MNTRSASRLARVVGALIVVLFATTLTLTALNRSAQTSGDVVFVALAIPSIVGYATVGVLVASRHPRNPLGWLFCGFALFFVLSGFASEYVTHALVVAPGSFPGATVVAWVNTWILALALSPVVLVPLLFPTGRLPSRRWRPVVWATVLGTLIAIIGSIISTNPLESPEGVRLANPTAVESLRWLSGLLLLIGGVSLIAAALASALALVVRFRQASGEERQQVRWLAYAAATAAALFVAALVSGRLFGENSVAINVLFYAFFAIFGLGIPAATGIAILKYRLYELDVVVKKTVVFGALVAFITAVYVAIVVGLGALVGSSRNPVLQFAATAIVAIAFQPVRARARRLADRVVYGKRATPYEVLSAFSDRIASAYSTDDVLPRMAEILASGTAAARARVWLRVGSSLHPAATWPADGEPDPEPLPLAGNELPAFAQADRAFPVRHQGELLGALTVSDSPADPLSPSQERLSQDLASQAGLVLRNVRLIEELRASRQRLVAAQDQERRRLERNIHDGAQQQLVALSVRLRLAERLAQKESASQTETALAQLQAEATDALENLRDLARGIYPPLLADKGLAAALEAHARKSTVPVDVEADGVGRYPQEVEAAVYFCALEALQNMTKHAEANRAVIRLAEDEGLLRFEVEDDGHGFDATATPRGSGLQNMTDRLESLGGTLTVASSAGAGTAVAGVLPAKREDRRA